MGISQVYIQLDINNAFQSNSWETYGTRNRQLSLAYREVNDSLWLTTQSRIHHHTKLFIRFTVEYSYDYESKNKTIDGHSAVSSNELSDLHTTQTLANEVRWGTRFSGHRVATGMFAQVTPNRTSNGN